MVGEKGSPRIKEITIKGKVTKPNFQFQIVQTNWDATETLAFTGNEVEIT